jgi:hypothetical protein
VNPGQSKQAKSFMSECHGSAQIWAFPHDPAFARTINAHLWWFGTDVELKKSFQMVGSS